MRLKEPRNYKIEEVSEHIAQNRCNQYVVLSIEETKSDTYPRECFT